MIIWRGWGLVSVILPATLFAVLYLPFEATTLGRGLGALGLAAGGTIALLLGRRLNRALPVFSGIQRIFEPEIALQMPTKGQAPEPTEPVEAAARVHSVFFVRMEYVGLAILATSPIVFGVLVAVG